MYLLSKSQLIKISNILFFLNDRLCCIFAMVLTDEKLKLQSKQINSSDWQLSPVTRDVCHEWQLSAADRRARLERVAFNFSSALK